MNDRPSCSCASGASIDSQCTIDAVIARHPASIFVLNAFGIDTCCGGGDSLEQAATHARVDPVALLASLERVTQS